jgi:hypothetical protein
MKKDKMTNLIKNLEIGSKKTIYNKNNTEIYVVRPNKKFKNYNINKNFQIFLKQGNREFRPNHLRVMIDLNLRVRSKPDLKKTLLNIFDNIYYGEDPIIETKEIAKEKFDYYLNDIEIIAILSQLFIIEQEYNYNKESNFEPKTLFYQGWIRQFIIDNTKEIDNLCMSICNGQTPKVTYTCKENKKHKKYIENRTKLWYFE